MTTYPTPPDQLQEADSQSLQEADSQSSLTADFQSSLKADYQSSQIAHNSNWANSKKYPDQKLTEGEILQVSHWIHEGMGVKEACNQCLSCFGVSISMVALRRKPAVKEALKRKRSLDRVEASESLQKCLGPTMLIITDRMTANAKEAQNIERNLKKYDVGSREYRAATSRLKDIDSCLPKYIGVFNSIYNVLNKPETEVGLEEKVEETLDDFAKDLFKVDGKSDETIKH